MYFVIEYIIYILNRYRFISLYLLVKTALIRERLTFHKQDIYSKKSQFHFQRLKIQRRAAISLSIGLLARLILRILCLRSPLVPLIRFMSGSPRDSSFVTIFFRASKAERRDRVAEQGRKVGGAGERGKETDKLVEPFNYSIRDQIGLVSRRSRGRRRVAMHRKMKHGGIPTSRRTRRNWIRARRRARFSIRRYTLSPRPPPPLHLPLSHRFLHLLLLYLVLSLVLLSLSLVLFSFSLSLENSSRILTSSIRKWRNWHKNMKLTITFFTKYISEGVRKRFVKNYIVNFVSLSSLNFNI